MLTNYESLDATELANLVASGEVTAREVIETAVARAEEKNPAINAIVTPMFEAALAVTLCPLISKFFLRH